tara:strand:- start:52 stop:168 length:117 start_codon:yes stop_codon:yes gene_type:complete
MEGGAVKIGKILQNLVSKDLVSIFALIFILFIVNYIQQ